MQVIHNSASPVALTNAKPAPFPLPIGRTAILMIDMQRDFIMRGGYGYLQCSSENIFNEVSKVIHPCVEVLKSARELGLTVIHTREGHMPDLSDCPPSKRYRQYLSNPSNYPLLIGDKGTMGRLLVRGEYGHEIIDSLKPLSSEIIIDKPGKGTFYNTDIHQILVSRGLTHLLICGVTTECCVATTFREANDRGFDCCVLSDCTGGFDFNIVKETLNVACAYDGLLGSLGLGSDLIHISENSKTGSLMTQDSGSIKIKLAKIIENNGLLFENVKFATSGDLNTESSSLVNFLLDKGAIMTDCLSIDLDFFIAVDYGVRSMSEGEFRLAMSFSSGMLSLKGDKYPSSINSISIHSDSMFNIRYAYSNLRFYDSGESRSKQYYEYPIYPVDYRGVALGGFTFSTPDPEIFENLNVSNGIALDNIPEMVVKAGGSWVTFNWRVLISVVTLAFEGTEKFPVGPLLLEIQSQLKARGEGKMSNDLPKSLDFSHFGEASDGLSNVKRQLANQMRGVDLLVLPSTSTIHFQKKGEIILSIISRIMGWPCITLGTAVFMSKFGTDGRLLDILQEIEIHI